MKTPAIRNAYRLARAAYAEWDIDTDAVLKALARIPISMHCWQGDDVTGFEKSGSISDGGIMATGNYPGRARTPDELRKDLDKAYSLVPGRHRLNLHALYAETNGRKVDRNELDFAHFSRWTDWARDRKLGMDFNPSCFAHPKAASGFTLSHKDDAIRRFWVEHCIACRKIGARIGRALASPCITNIWIPDGYKDVPADRQAPRLRLEKSLDDIFAREIDPRYNRDAVEGKLFGIGSESYVTGSFEFYMGYAVKNNKLLTLDTGHFHPTETVADKLSAALIFVNEVLLHVSRGVRWDSDHVVILSDDLKAIAEELVWNDHLDRVHIGLDYFDASINRIAAWVIGMRSMIKALLLAMLTPADQLRRFEAAGDFTSRLALFEETKTLPASAVWNYYCLKQDVPVGMDWLKDVKSYEKSVLAKR